MLERSALKRGAMLPIRWPKSSFASNRGTNQFSSDCYCYLLCCSIKSRLAGLAHHVPAHSGGSNARLLHSIGSQNQRPGHGPYLSLALCLVGFDVVVVDSDVSRKTPKTARCHRHKFKSIECFSFSSTPLHPTPKKSFLFLSLAR